MAALERIVVVGDVAHIEPIFGGGGSGEIVPMVETTPFEGIQAKVGSSVELLYVPTENRSHFANEIGSAGAVVVVVGATSGEFEDRQSLSLPDSDNDLVARVLELQANVVVVVHSPGAILMPWASDAPSILLGFLPGQEDGLGLADVLFGDVSPGAHLPLTIPNVENEVGFTAEMYPGVFRDGLRESDFTDELNVGYRWYDARGVEPLFPFGHGLSYSTFEFTGMVVTTETESAAVSFRLTNVGDVSAQEVAQLYLGFPRNYDEPPHQLKGFEKVSLDPGQFEDVVFQLSKRDFSFFDVTSRSWEMATGDFVLKVGSSSRNLPLEACISLPKPESPDPSSGMFGLESGVFIGIVCGFGLAVGLFFGGVYVSLRSKRAASQSSSTEDPLLPTQV
jgi:beta-glucosidase